MAEEPHENSHAILQNHATPQRSHHGPQNLPRETIHPQTSKMPQMLDIWTPRRNLHNPSSANNAHKITHHQIPEKTTKMSHMRQTRPRS
jgi:hypothetical protein